MQSNLTYTDSIARQIEQEQDHPEVEYFTATNVGREPPNLLNVIPENERTDCSDFVQLNDNTAPHKKLGIIEELRKVDSRIQALKSRGEEF